MTNRSLKVDKVEETFPAQPQQKKTARFSNPNLVQWKRAIAIQNVRFKNSKANFFKKKSEF